MKLQRVEVKPQPVEEKLRPVKLQPVEVKPRPVEVKLELVKISCQHVDFENF